MKWNTQQDEGELVLVGHCCRDWEEKKIWEELQDQQYFHQLLRSGMQWTLSYLLTWAGLCVLPGTLHIWKT